MGKAIISLVTFLFVFQYSTGFSATYPWQGHPKVPTIKVEQIKYIVPNNEPHIFIDAQPRDFFIKHHLCGAISYPYNFLPPHPDSIKYENFKIPKSAIIFVY